MELNWISLLFSQRLCCVDISIAMTTYLKSPLHLQLMRFIYLLINSCYPEETRCTSKNQSACLSSKHRSFSLVTVRRFHKADKVWWMQDGKRGKWKRVFFSFFLSSPCLDSSILCSMHEREAVWSVSGVSMTVTHREALKCAALPRTLQPIAHSHSQKTWNRP